jgi:hypothetical protein
MEEKDDEEEEEEEEEDDDDDDTGLDRTDLAVRMDRTLDLVLGRDALELC